MSLFKLAVYGGIGYLIYQNFFADAPPAETPQGKSKTMSQQVRDRGEQGNRVATQDRDGGSTTHRVGRGVVTS